MVERQTVIDQATQQHLRTRNAALSLPFCLPNELLSEIFQIACAASNARSTTLKCISHVCHLWRHVALSCNQLWICADYEYDHPEWVRAQLQRSANMPVVVKAHFPMAAQSVRGMHNLSLALKTVAIHTLDLQASPEILDQVWTGLDPASLRTLSLFIPLPDIPKLTPPYPGPSFHLNTPHLRNLSLSNCVVSWDSPLFTNLTHLRLHLQDQTFAPSMTNILRMLAASPMLIELILLHAIENSSRLPLLKSVSVVPLSHVATLLLDSDLLNHIFLLRHVDIPVNCNLSLKAEHQKGKTGSIAELGYAISQSLSLAQVENLCVELEPCGAVVRGYAATCPANPRIHVALRHSETDLDVVGPMLCSLALTATTALELSVRGPHAGALRIETWRTLLRSFRSVEKLQVKPTTPRNLLSALTGSEGGSVLLPRLSRLEVHHPDVNPTPSHELGLRKPGPVGSWWQKTPVAEVTFFDSLLACLNGRRKLNAGIDSLRLGRCPQLSGQQLDALKVAAKHVSIN